MTGSRLGRDVAVGPFAVDRGPGRPGGPRSRSGPGASSARAAEVGEDTELKPRVVLYPGTRVGRRCLMHSGVVLGGDGFGFATSGGRHHKMPQVGRVVIEDDVEIGRQHAPSTGARWARRVIGEGSKIDNLVMIAHGVRIGRASLLAAQSGIAGSTRVGDAHHVGRTVRRGRPPGDRRRAPSSRRSRPCSQDVPRGRVRRRHPGRRPPALEAGPGRPADGCPSCGASCASCGRASESSRDGWLTRRTDRCWTSAGS